MKGLLIKSEEPSDMDVNSGMCVCGAMISMQKSHTEWFYECVGGIFA